MVSKFLARIQTVSSKSTDCRHNNTAGNRNLLSQVTADNRNLLATEILGRVWERGPIAWLRWWAATPVFGSLGPLSNPGAGVQNGPLGLAPGKRRFSRAWLQAARGWAISAAAAGSPGKRERSVHALPTSEILRLYKRRLLLLLLPLRALRLPLAT